MVPRNQILPQARRSHTHLAVSIGMENHYFCFFVMDGWNGRDHLLARAAGWPRRPYYYYPLFLFLFLHFLF